ncbi:phage tail terminator-like protein [Phyllobacterium ifriqiyense]|uniref:phage tail terminator-like protein n=1 Tax=Phyllobacterium ifriqiyense TaxID=314238 RepID=UPI003391D28B
MATSVEGTILSLLLARLAALVLSPALPVAQPGIPFIAPIETSGPNSGKPKPYLRADFIPNRTENLGIADDAKARHQGILQVMVVHPSGIGAVKPTDIGGAVAAHFAKGTKLYGSGVKVKVYQKPSVGAPMIETDKIYVPVTILWHSFN